MVTQNQATQPTTPNTVDMGGEDLKAELERLKKENETLKANAKKVGTFSMKVTEKGGVSIYGLGRFPVTLYPEQWIRLLGDGVNGDFGKAAEIHAFIAENLKSGALKVDAEEIKKSKAEAKLRTDAALAKLPPKKK